jgi:hypothetical protein
MKLSGYANETFALCLLPTFNPLAPLCSLQLLESHNTTLMLILFFSCNSLNIFHHIPFSFPL